MIVLDQHLPDLAVTELCPRIRAEQHGEASTIVVLVEQADTAERDDILAAGADDCLVWPIDAMALRTHLETLEASAVASAPTVLASIVASVGEQGEAAIVLGRDGTVRDATTELSDWLERPTDALLGESAFTLLHVDDAPELLSLSTQALETTEITGSVFVRFQSIDGGWRRLHLRALNRFDDPQVDGIVLLASQAEVEVVAPTLPDNPLRDEATGLASAALFMDRLEHALLLAERRQEPVMAMVIGLNGLDDQDRVDGAADLDSVAMQVAECMRERLRRGDTAARIGPREFGALCEDIRDADDALDLVRNLIGALQEPLAVEDAKRNITPCIGAVLSWNGHGTASEVLDEARIAHRVAAGHAQTDGHFALHELGQRPEGDPQVIVVDERPAPMLVLDPADADEIWYTPLMDRIGRLENEIGRLNERRASTRLAQTL
jgi:GGDEF domain-containing protein